MHCFCVGTDLVSAFTIGYPTEPDNFYMVGETLFDAPLISCRIHGTSGEFLFGLKNNKLTTDSPTGYRQLGLHEHAGLQILDDVDRQVLAIETVDGEEAEEVMRSLEKKLGGAGHAPSDIDESAINTTKITRIHGDFFDKHGRLAARGDLTGLSYY